VWYIKTLFIGYLSCFSWTVEMTRYPQDSIKDTLFFKIVQLAFDNGKLRTNLILIY